jgi:3-methyl-2-oxobutanoate hydroxymethyltransferase
MAQSGIPVMGHLGLQPQSVHAYGGFRVQGRSDDSAREIARQAAALEELGAFAIVVECVPAILAQEISSALRIPTIGIGAGAGCDGQILVLQDLLGMNMDARPKFARPFLDGSCRVLDALARFDEAVKARTFPAGEESYS